MADGKPQKIAIAKAYGSAGVMPFRTMRYDGGRQSENRDEPAFPL